MENLLDLYTDYLLSNLVAGVVGHDKITRSLSNSNFTSKFAYVKLERLKFTNKMNDFALKTAFKELTLLKHIAHA